MRRARLNADPDTVREFVQRGQRNTTRKRRPVSPASQGQREVVNLAGCAVCLRTPVDPAHLIDRSLCSVGADDPRAVVGLCREHHDAYDEGGLDLLPHLEPRYRAELAFAVERFGLLPTLRRVTNTRWKEAA